MPPAIIAAAASIASTAVTLFVKSKVLAAILLLAISVASAAIATKSSKPLSQGQELKLKLDPTMPRQVALGKTATGGSLVWAFTYTDTSSKPNRYLVRVIDLSDLPINQVLQVRVGKEILTFGGADIHTGLRACDQYRSKSGAACLWLQVHKGSPTATADSNLIAWSGGVWTSAHRGTNICYAVLRMDNDPDAFSTGEPGLTFVVEGTPLYDERYDSSVGGSGSQRLNDPSTWVYTSNATVITANLLRGLYSKGVLLAGAQAEARDLDTTMLMAAHNICDQAIISSVGYIPRYRAGLMASGAESTASMLLDLQSAFDGRIIDRGGAITLRPGAVRTPVLNLTDDDIIWTEQKSWQPRASLSELCNHITGTYVSEDNGYQDKAFPILSNPAWEIQDGGERFSKPYSFRAIFNDSQVQRITQRMYAATRYQGTVAFVLPIWALELEQDDWFTLTSVRWGFASKTFVAVKADIVVKDELYLAVFGREVDPTSSTWSASNEVPRGDTVWNPPGPALEIPGYTPTAYYSYDSGTLKEEFGIKVAFTNIPIGILAKQIEIELAPSADLTSRRVLGMVAAVNQEVVYTGLKPSTNYSVRIRTTDGKRYSDYSTWATFTTPASTVNLGATVSALQTDIDAAEAAVAAANASIGILTGNVSSLNTITTSLTSRITAAEGDIVTTNSTLATLGASVTSQGTAITNLTGNLSSLTTEVRATAGIYISRNGNFATWTNGSGNPDYWGTYGSGGSLARVANNRGGYAARLTTTGPSNDWGLAQSYTQAALDDIRPGWYVLEFELKLISGTLQGVALQLSCLDSSAAGVEYPNITAWQDKDSTNTVVGNGVVGKYYRFTKLIQVTNAATVKANLDLVANWNGWAGPAKTIEVYWAAVRVATQEEIARQTVLAPLEATVSTHTITLSTLGTNLASLTSTVEAENSGVQNVLVNGDFSNGFTGWVDSNGGWVVEDSAPGRRAAYGITGTPVLYGPLFGTAPGWTYTAGMLKLTDERPSHKVGISIVWYDSSFNYISQEPFSITHTGARYRVTGTSPAGAIYGRPVIFALGSDSGYVEVSNVTCVIGYVDVPNAPAIGTLSSQRAAITTNATAIATTNSSLASLTSTVATLNSSVTTQAIAISTLNTNYSSLSSTVTSQGISITSTISAVTTLQGNVITLLGRAALTLDVNGYITGYEINNNGTVSEFIIRADRFKIANATGVPFELSGSQIRMANVKIGTANIDNLAVGSAQINSGGVLTDNIGISAVSYTISATATTPPAVSSTPVDVVSASVSLADGIIAIWFSFTAIAFGGSEFTMTLTRDGTALRTWGTGMTGQQKGYSMMYMDTPGAGVHTYAVRITRITGSGSADIQNANIILMNLKR